MKIEKATEAEIADFLSQHERWSTDSGKLRREFVFRNFREAFGFMAEVALAAEQGNHHPEWCNVHNRVTVHLVTHQANGISHRDFDLAGKIDTIVSSRSKAV